MGLRVLIVLWLISLSCQIVPKCPAKCSCNASSMTCNNKQLATAPNFKKLEFLPEHIELSNNDLTEITGNDFNFLNNPKLKLARELTLSNNSIIDVAEDAFMLLQKLTHLDLSGNFLEDLPEQIFATNLQMKHLKLSHNVFVDGPKIVSDSIVTLDLSFNKISSFGEDSLGVMPNLTHLYLQSNNLKHLNYNIFVGRRIEFVELGDNLWKCNCKTVDMFAGLVQENLTQVRKYFTLILQNRFLGFMMYL